MRSSVIALRSRRADRGQHPGLLLQRYLSADATGAAGDPEEKRAVLQAAINAAKNEQVRGLYKIAFERWSESLPSDSATVDLVTTGRLIVGLGSENVLETGIRLHHTYGMPILPGSALKGLAAHYCHKIWRPTDSRFSQEAGAFHHLLFGTTDDGGCIIFHDAWYIPDSNPEPLVLDVMTPHHIDYNRDPKTDPSFRAPTDFDSPTPVPFLSVAGTFRVAVSWRGPANDKAKNWTELGRALLCDALRYWGIGGKTTSGYGRLANSTDAPPRKNIEPPAAKQEDPDKATVKVLERRDIGGKVQYFVQEEGKPRGVLAYGIPPPADKLPQVGDEIVVYRNNRDSRNPQYRWDKPVSHQAKPKGGPGGQRPRGRR